MSAAPKRWDRIALISPEGVAFMRDLANADCALIVDGKALPALADLIDAAVRVGAGGIQLALLAPAIDRDETLSIAMQDLGIAVAKGAAIVEDIL